jgi:diguanylate cyclase (GGDEF)-like protein
MYIPEKLLTLIQASRQGYALFDEADRLRYANPMFRETFGLATNESPSWVDLMRKNHQQGTGTHIEATEFESWLASARSRRGKLPYRTIETDLNDGRWVLTTETTQPDGWMLCVVTDITALTTDWRTLRQERDRAVKSAMTDDLTGLSNRRYLMTHLNQMLGPEKKTVVAVVILDIDNFKRVNDTFGHDVGDMVLIHFGFQLQAHVRRNDLAGRIGGEEFLLALRGMTIENVQRTLERLFSAVRTSSPLSNVQSFRYTCSAGVALAKSGETTEDLLRRADTMLYRAKNEGRNRYIVDD